MIAHHTYRWEHREIRWELGLYRGLGDWRLGVYVEHHKYETQVSFHVPCLALVVLRNR